jgi:hypothetical protein
MVPFQSPSLSGFFPWAEGVVVFWGIFILDFPGASFEFSGVIYKILTKPLRGFLWLIF